MSVKIIEDGEDSLLVHKIDEKGVLLLKNCFDIEQRLIYKPKICIFGKVANMQRSIGFFSDVSGGYKYSGQISKAMPLTNDLNLLLQYVNDKLASKFNGILVNMYENGDDYISKHSDDETGLDANAGVVSLSLGAERKFRIREKETGQILVDVPTKEDEMIQMCGPNFQKKYTHEIPKQKNVGKRISFTFRCHLK